MNAFLLRKNCNAFKNRPDCEKHYYYAPPTDAPPTSSMRGMPVPGGSSGAPRVGSCGWDMRIRRCVILPPQKEPCNLFGMSVAKAAAPSREFSKLFDASAT